MQQGINQEMNDEQFERMMDTITQAASLSLTLSAPDVEFSPPENVVFANGTLLLVNSMPAIATALLP